MRSALLWVCIVFAASLTLNWEQWKKIDSLRDDIAHLQTQNAILLFARDQDDEAYRNAQKTRQEAARQAEHDKEKLKQAADCADDADYLDALARMWRDKACSTRPDNAAHGTTR